MKAMKQLHELEEIFARGPINRHLGLELVSRSPKQAVVSMDVLPELIQEEGVLHGGIISTLADTAAVYLFLPDLAAGQTMTSIEFKVNFLSPALDGRGPVVAESQLIRKGSQVGVAEVSVRQSDKLVARGTFTYLFITRRDGRQTDK
jgi:uncharacterized protein (TIGR00369 family)